MDTGHFLMSLGYPADAGWALVTADHHRIRRRVPHGVCGVYLLIAERRIIYVGRSDGDLRGRLMTHEYLERAVLVAWYRSADATSAYHLERRWYDRLYGRDGVLNTITPANPSRETGRLGGRQS